MARATTQETDAFIDAIEKGDLSGVRSYVSKKINLNFIYDKKHYNDMYVTPLLVAINAKKIDVIEYLIENGAEVNYKTSYECAPLHYAIYNKCPLDIVKLLVNKDADVNLLARYSCYLENIKYTPISVSIMENYFEAAKLLISSGADMCLKNSDGTTAVTLAQKYNQTEILDYYFTPLGYAIFTKKIDQARKLLEDGADACNKGASKKTPLVLAVEQGNLEAVKLLFEFGASLTMKNALLEAINVGNVEIINFFIENNVAINCKYRDGITPLIRAVQKGNFKVVKILVESGADVNFTDVQGFYPLFDSLKLDDCEIAKYLISKGAKMDCKCLMQDHFQCVKNLMKMEVELKSVVLGNFDTCTLLKAVETGNPLFVKYLLEQGFSTELYDKNGKSPLAVAAKNRSFTIVAILIYAGADVDSAKEELEEFANENDDFYLYYQDLKPRTKPKSQGLGEGLHEAAD
ncbi:putative ankyrin repeat protein RF_0381 isoform X2 [Tribolium castaneum]|uniref:putative ankyrin repeat protein RF_0381 isoform X2 n=1 Tax=Tribolium castaneum TaxID=7070 RepID=UPI0030FE9190